MKIIDEVLFREHIRKQFSKFYHTTKGKNS